jgi:hypothetical protein
LEQLYGATQFSPQKEHHLYFAIREFALVWVMP